MVSVVCEPRCLYTNQWFGKVGAGLGDLLYVNYSSDEKFEDMIDDLYNKVINVIQVPLNDRLKQLSSSFLLKSDSNHNTNSSSSDNGGVNTSLEGESSQAKYLGNEKIHLELCNWLIRDAKIIAEDADRYASLFIKNKISSIDRLKRFIDKIANFQRILEFALNMNFG